MVISSRVQSLCYLVAVGSTLVRMKEIGKNSLNVIFFSAIGDDEQGKLLSKAVVDGGVNPNFIVMSEYATGSCITG